MQVFWKQGASLLIQETQQVHTKPFRQQVRAGKLSWTLARCCCSHFLHAAAHSSGDSAPRLPVLHGVMCYLVGAWCLNERVSESPGPWECSRQAGRSGLCSLTAMQSMLNL